MNEAGYIRTARFTLAVMLAACASAVMADTVTVKDEVYVKGPKVTLGDVADIEGPMAETLSQVELTYAATPGGTKRVNAALIESRIRNAGVKVPELNIEGASSARATTLHLEVSGEMLAEDLRRYIGTSMPWDPKNAVVEVTPPSQTLVLPDGNLEIRWQPAPQYRYVGTGGFSGQIFVDGDPKRTVMCSATITPYTDVLVAVDDIGRGDLLRAGDVTVERRPVASLRYGALSSVDELDGQVARSTILPGEVITKRQVTPQQIVKKNQIVTIEVQSGALTVQTRARALDNAGAGETVTCENLTSKGQFMGIVREDGVVIAQ